VDLGIADDDRPQLFAIARPKHVGAEGRSPGQVRDVLAVDWMVSSQLRECEVVGLEVEELQVLEPPWKELAEPFGV
jgi:hypothetical protein